MRRELVVVLAIGCGRVNFDPVGGSGSPNDGDVIGDIERGDGFVTSGCGALPIRVSSAGIRARKPAIAWSGTELAYVWIEDATTDTIHFQRFDRQGDRIGAEQILGSSNIVYGAPRVVWADTGWGVSWTGGATNNTDIFFTRVDTAGTEIGTELQVSNAALTSDDSALGWNGTEYAIAWYDVRDGNGEQYFARISAAGAMIGGELRGTNSNGTSNEGSLAWNGFSWGLSYIDPQGGGETVWYQGFLNGTLAGNPQRTVFGGDLCQDPSIAWNGSDYGLLWSARPTADSVIRFSLMGQGGALVGTTLDVTPTPGNASSPNIVVAGAGFYAAWMYGTASNARLQIAALDVMGQLDGASLLQLGAATSESSAPSLVWLGTAPSVAWPEVDDTVWLYLPCP